MATHERMFEIPISQSSGPRHIFVNALYLLVIDKTAQTDGTVTVMLNIGGANYTTSFPSDAEAQAFVDLWTARAEEAR